MNCEEMIKSRRSSGHDRRAQKTLLGVGFMVQGLRSVPLRAVSYFMRDDLLVDFYTLQILKNTVNLPQVAKPIYGIISDTLYIHGQHRIPYIALGGITIHDHVFYLRISDSNNTSLNTCVLLHISVKKCNVYS